jgi:hypothetical protein
MKYLIASCCLALSLVGVGCASSGSLTPKVQIDRWDRAAAGSVRAFQLVEQASWQAKADWDTPATHHKIAVLLGGDPNCTATPTTPCAPGIYDLIIDVANIGLKLPAGTGLSVADLRAVSALEAAVQDLVSIVSASSNQQVKEKATQAHQDTQNLLHTVVNLAGAKP